jgi:type II secretory pathway component PulF
MPSFVYKAIDGNGETVKGVVEENHIDNAYDNISSTGLYVLNISQSNRLNDFYLKKLRVLRIRRKDIVEFASNLSVMLKAGLPLLASISDIADSTDNKRFMERLLDIKRAVELGSGFSDALSRHKDVFPEIFINLTAVGEETGRLSESLSDISVHLQRMENLRSAMVRALIYPAFAFAASIGALLFWLIYVLPKVSTLFTSMAVELPAITHALIITSDFTSSHWYIIFVVPFIVYIALKLLSKKEAAKYYIDAAKLKIPIMNLIVSNKLLALFTEQLRILFAAGVTIDRSLDIIIKIINNAVFRKALKRTKEDIMLGSKISDSLKKNHTLFPNLVVRLISVGESTGNLTEQLNYLSEYFLNKLDDISQKIGKMMEPIIIMVIGSMFLIIILGLLSPIYNLVSGMG